jgi:uncharacterized protein YndB with AHSA1/START domain
VAELSLSVEVDASVETVWRAATDWAGQREWMLLTDVTAGERGGAAVGGTLSARTGAGPLAFVDPMTITLWQPPYRCVVRHDGRVVRGTAAFEVQPLPGGRARFVWSEWLRLPFGWLGELGFAALKPLVAAPIRYSLRAFARWAPTRELTP